MDSITNEQLQEFLQSLSSQSMPDPMRSIYNMTQDLFRSSCYEPSYSATWSGPVNEQTPQQKIASNKVEIANQEFKSNQIQKSISYCINALYIDPTCIQAWHLLCMQLNSFTDPDTIICCLREVLNFSRNYFYLDKFEVCPGNFYTSPDTIPYINILNSIADLAKNVDMIDIFTFALEEILRLNNADNLNARKRLLCAYLRLYGCLSRGEVCYPIRDRHHIEALIDSSKLGSNPNGSCFGANPGKEMVVRWARIILAYQAKEDWEGLVRQENSYCQIIFQQIFKEKDNIPLNSRFLDRSSPNPEREAMEISPYLVDALREWPQFVIDCHSLLRRKSTRPFMREVKARVPENHLKLTQVQKLQYTTIGQHMLQVGRDSLKNGEYLQAASMFSFAKRSFVDNALPSHRWYADANFAIVSNRGTSAARLGYWFLVRFDARFTLIMNPEHARTYERIPAIMENLMAPEMKLLAEQLLNEIKGKSCISNEEWIIYSRRAIAMLSIPAIVASRKGELTQMMLDDLIQVGIDDCFVSVNVGPDLHPILPWLQESDIEPPQ